MRLIFSGDFYPSKKMINRYLLGEPIFDKQIIELFKNSDYCFINLESPILINPKELKKNFI